MCEIDGFGIRNFCAIDDAFHTWVLRRESTLPRLGTVPSYRAYTGIAFISLIFNRRDPRPSNWNYLVLMFLFLFVFID